MKTFMLVSELEDYTIALANGVSSHASVILAVPLRRYARYKADFNADVDLRLLDWPRHSSLSNPRFLAEITRLIRREQPDVIHMLSNTTLWLNAAIPFWGMRPLVTTVHDVELHPGDIETAVLPRWATDLAVRQSDDIIVHGDRLRDLAIARFRKPADRVHSVPHPAISRYVERARRIGLTRKTDDGSFTVLMFGRMFAYKGLTQLIQAEASLGSAIPNLRIVIAGRGDDAWEHRGIMGDPDRYDVRNEYIEDDVVAQLFLDADVVALPYVEASQSGVLNVAAAFGCPVVATDVGELGATVAANGLGLVVPPGDPARFAAALADLAANPSQAAAFGANAIAWAEGPNSASAIGARVVEVYAEMIGRGAAAERRKATGPSAGRRDQERRIGP